MKYSLELEQLIETIIANGAITDETRSLLTKRALLDGVDPQEVDEEINRRLHVDTATAISMTSILNTVVKDSSVLSKELKELIILAVIPGKFDEDKRKVIYRRADREGISRGVVDKEIDAQVRIYSRRNSF